MYLQRGWAPIPLPPLRKDPPLSGWTGGSAPYPDAAQVQAWVGSGHADGNIALRMRPGQLGVDVDAYDGKPGARTLREWQEHLGDELPGTWISTSRLEEHDGVLSGIRHYRLPPGVPTKGWAGGAPGIEFIRQGHRYAVAPPSRHDRPGHPEYLWVHSLSGEVREDPPAVDELPVLDEQWCDFFASVKPVRSARSSSAAAWQPSGQGGAAMCPVVENRLGRALMALETGGSRHDSTRNAVMGLVRQQQHGHRGVSVAVRALRDVFVNRVVADGSRTSETAQGEFARMGEGAVLKTVAEPSSAGSCECDYLTASTSAVAAATAAAPDRVSPRLPDPFNYLAFDSEWWAAPPAPFIIPELLVENRVGTVYAVGGQGKSLLVQDIVVGLTVRGVVFGLPVQRIPVLYLDRENPEDDVRERLRDMGLGPADDLSLLHYSHLGAWPPLDTTAGGSQLLAEVRRTGARLVVIDTMSKVVAGPENDAPTWNGMHTKTMVALKAEGVSVIQIDHAGKDPERGPRGSSASTTTPTSSGC